VCPKYKMSHAFKLEALPEYSRFQKANPNSQLDAKQTIMMFGRAIHWLSIFEIIWPNFEEKDYFSVEVAYLVYNDPDDKNFPDTLYDQIARVISTFWTIQLDDLYPNGDWIVSVGQDPEITVSASIRKRV
jgi:hypothetical protein